MSGEIEPSFTAVALSAAHILDEMPHLSDSDKPMVMRYIQLSEERVKLQAIRESEGLFVAGEKGGIAAHPVVKMIADNEKALLQMEDRLGMNPAAKLKLGADKLKNKREEASLASMLNEIEDN